MNEPTKPPAERSVVAPALFALIAGCVTYAVAMGRGSVGIWYLPLARAWVFGQKPAGVAMSWYGRTGYVLAFGALGAALGRAVPRPGVRFARVGGVVAAATLIAAVTVCVTVNFNRSTKPLPAPDDRPVVCAPGP
ncbi:MAG TPA: hypothetical protein VLA14_00400 [Polyangia bacterium]|jgi:hypothetical protein|nr:hypothetical protein [Polyangia bacterium]